MNVKKSEVVDYLRVYSSHPLNVDFDISELTNMFVTDDQGVFDNWDVLIANGLNKTPADSFAGLEIPFVIRGFAYKKDTRSLQMSGKNSRLGSRNLAKGGLDVDTVTKMEEGQMPGKALSEDFYFRTGMRRNPLLVIYPVRLTEPKNGKNIEEAKTIASKIDFPVIGLSIGIPLVDGKKRKTIRFKVNKQRWFELCGVSDDEDFEETDETVEEE